MNTAVIFQATTGRELIGISIGSGRCSRSALCQLERRPGDERHARPEAATFGATPPNARRESFLFLSMPEKSRSNVLDS